MVAHNSFLPAVFERDSMPLDTARAAFAGLVTGPDPVAVDGRLFAGLPVRRVPLDELRDRLLRRRCPQSLRDAVWAHLVLRTRTEGGTWTVGATGVALPALTKTAAILSARFAGDPSDIHAAVLAGFVAELAVVELRKPRIMLRLRWAAYRAGHTCVREALDAPVPSGNGFRSSAPPPPSGHPDFVLARAVADGAITAAEAELIGCTRLEERTLTAAAAERGVKITALHNARSRAERRLRTWLVEQAPTDTPPETAGQDVATDALHSAALTAAASDSRLGSARHVHRARTVTRAGRPTTRKSRGRVWKTTAESGVQGCGSEPAHNRPLGRPRRSPSPTSEVL